MPNLFRSREGALTTEDAKTQLTVLGSQSAPGPLLVPGGATHLKAAYVCGANDGQAATAYAILCRLEGPGIERGVFNFPVSSGGSAVATGTHQKSFAQRVPINIAVRAGQEVLVFAEAVGEDAGAYHVGVTLEFGSEAGPEGEILGEITVEGDITDDDVLTRLTGQGSVTAPSRLTPPDATTLKRLFYTISGNGAADGVGISFIRIGGDAIKGGEQTLMLAAESWIDVASGGDGDGNNMPVMMLDNLDLEVTPNETLDISVELGGEDNGTHVAVVTAMFV